MQLRILSAATVKGRARAEFQRLLYRINHNDYYDLAGGGADA